MATESQIDIAESLSKKRHKGKKDGVTGGVALVDSLIYTPGSRAEQRDGILATYALYRQFRDYDTLSDYDEFKKFAAMLGLECYIERARKLYNTDRNERKRARINARRRRKGRASVDYLGDMADS